MTHPTHPHSRSALRWASPTHQTYQTHPPHATLAAVIALAAALGALTAGLRWGTFAAGGSDSSCYLNQSRLFAHGTTHIEQPLAAIAPWPRAEWTFTPAGHIPSPVRKDFIVPMCPPGLPLVMAPARVVDFGPFLVVPLCGALAVWLTFVLGRRLDGPLTGAASAVLLACSPIFLFQLVQPMTDVPAAAWWLLAAVLALEVRTTHAKVAKTAKEQTLEDLRGLRGLCGRVPLALGLAMSIAVLTRPNLLPLAAVVGVYMMAQGFSPANGVAIAGLKPCATFLWRRGTTIGWLLAGLAPGVALLAVLQTVMYGSPFATGYGAPAELFAARNVLPNLSRYTRWLAETHTPGLALALAAPFLVGRRADAWLCLGLVAATIAAYLPYQVFNDWWYIRFLLPAIPLLIVLSMIVVARIAGRLFPRFQAVAIALVVVAIGVSWIDTARERLAFDLQRLERHFIEAGTFAAQRLPARAAVLTVRHSGSVHYSSQRPIVSWDTLEPGSLDRTLAFLRAQGLTPILLLDAAEEPEFRMRFGARSDIGQVDWPPQARVGRTVRVYDPADRARYLAGAKIDTIEWRR